MSDTIQLIAAIVTGVTTIISAVFAGLAMLHAAKAKAESSKANEQIAVVKGEVHKIELATNSMKDALVSSVRTEATLQGSVDERARADAAALEQATSAAAGDHAPHTGRSKPFKAVIAPIAPVVPPPPPEEEPKS